MKFSVVIVWKCEVIVLIVTVAIERIGEINLFYEDKFCLFFSIYKLIINIWVIQ